MPFKKMQKQTYPPRQWSIVGYPGSGKSTFAAQMRGPALVIDADHRFTEVMDLCQGDIFQLSENKSDNADTDRICTLMQQNMPGSGVRTVIVDSLTAIISPIIVKAMTDKEKGRSKNLMNGFKDKALAMRQIIDSVTRWGTDCLWIYHLNDARDAKAQEVTKTTVSKLEIARLLRCINVQLEIIQDNDKRGVRVIWARKGRSGLVLWDDTDTWVNMPEKIEAALYDDLSKDEQSTIKAATISVFQSPSHAVNYSVEQGAFHTIEDAHKIYNHIKQECKPGSAKEMTALWVEEVQSRKIVLLQNMEQ